MNQKEYLEQFRYKFDVTPKAIDLRTMSKNYPNGIIPCEDIHQGIKTQLGHLPDSVPIDPYVNKIMNHEDDEMATHFTYIDWESLYLCPLFQRDVAPNHVRKIYLDFEPTAVLTACAIKITVGDKVYMILWDGHHTVQTCRLKGYTKFPVSYVDIDKVPEETMIKAGFDFRWQYAVWLAGSNMIKINSKNKRKLHSYDEFMIKLETKDADTVRIKAIFDKNTCVPKRHDNQPGAVTALKVSEDMFKLGSTSKDYELVKGSFLDRSLAFHRSVWPKSPIELEIFRPMSLLYHRAWGSGITLDASFDDDMGKLLKETYGDPRTCQMKLKESFYNALHNGNGNGDSPTVDQERVYCGLISLWNGRFSNVNIPVADYRWVI